MHNPVSYRSYIIVVSICASLTLAACGDTAPTSPGTAPVALVTSPASSQPTTAPATTAATSTTSPATTAATATTPAPTSPAGFDVTKVSATVKELDFLNQAKVTNAFLSPDGSLIATGDMKTLCLYTVGGQKQWCLTNKTSVDYKSLVWSPDGRYLAYTEDFILLAEEPDIWLVEVNSGKLTNLTEDNINEYGLAEKQESSKALIDQLPVFTPDSQKLFFLRYDNKSLTTTRVFQIDLPTGQPTAFGEFVNSINRSNTYGYGVSPDGKHIAYAAVDRDPKEVKNGLWLGDETGRNTLQLISSPAIMASRPNTKYAFVVDAKFSADNSYVLGQGYADTAAPYTNANDNVYIFTTAGKAVAAVDPANPVQWAAWSPTGSSLMTIVLDTPTNTDKNTQKAGIYLLDKPGGKSVSLAGGVYSAPFVDKRYRSFSWATNNTALFMRGSDQQMVLLQLTTK